MFSVILWYDTVQHTFLQIWKHVLCDLVCKLSRSHVFNFTPQWMPSKTTKASSVKSCEVNHYVSLPAEILLHTNLIQEHHMLKIFVLWLYAHSDTFRCYFEMMISHDMICDRKFSNIWRAAKLCNIQEHHMKVHLYIDSLLLVASLLCLMQFCAEHVTTCALHQPGHISICVFLSEASKITQISK